MPAHKSSAELTPLLLSWCFITMGVVQHHRMLRRYLGGAAFLVIVVAGGMFVGRRFLGGDKHRRWALTTHTMSVPTSARCKPLSISAQF